MKKMKILTLLIFFTTSIPVLSPQTIGLNESKVKHIKKLNRIQQLKNSNFSPEKLMEYLQLKDISNYKIVYKQAILETGWFKSKSFIKYNNLFGMKVPRKRANLVNGVGYGHSSFNHWTDSVDDFLLWQNYWKEKGKDLFDYYNFLTKLPYAVDMRYVKKLKNMKLSGFLSQT